MANSGTPKRFDENSEFVSTIKSGRARLVAPTASCDRISVLLFNGSNGSHIRAYGARPYAWSASAAGVLGDDGEHAWVTAPAGTLTVRLYVCRHQPFVP